MYNYFAKYYDLLMEDFPYDMWESFVYENTTKDIQLVDIGCGTGTILSRIEKNGYFGLGLDISLEMLTIAKEKCKNFKFYEYDITESLALYKEKQITCFVDSINYITTKEEVIKFFNDVYNALEVNGVFLLDYHTVKKINEVFIGHEEFHELEDCEFYWNTVKGPIENSCIHHLEFSNDQHFYKEEHTQVSFGDDFYINELKNIGFEVKIDKRTDDMRIFAIAHKR